jgi:aminomethyltransferase
MEDGVVFRHSETDFLLTAARPNLGWLADHAKRLRVGIEDVSEDHGILAVQGPRSRAVLSALAPETGSLAFFEHTQAKVAGAPVTVSRTGYTGDLGYELTVDAGDALAVLDAVLDAGRDHGLRPFGEEALMMLRIEAGLPLVDVEWTNSRLAPTDHQRVTPTELGLGWMLRDVHDEGRPFVGRTAIRRELDEGTSRWRTVGIVVDWQHWDRLHRDAGLLPAKDEHPLPYESMLYDASHGDAGYATSVMYSPVLQRHVGLARVRPALAEAGTELHLELTVNHHPTTVRVRTARLPLFDPARKTAMA